MLGKDRTTFRDEQQLCRLVLRSLSSILPSGNLKLNVIPKGLRSFDANDADFFLYLLPGPRDRDGLPESVRFWKDRIEERDETTFTVGVIYGPSGCGKSSLVKAGLLPRLGTHVLSVYVEATANETEARLLKALRKRVPWCQEPYDAYPDAEGDGPVEDKEGKFEVISTERRVAWRLVQQSTVVRPLCRPYRRCADEPVLQRRVSSGEDFNALILLRLYPLVLAFASHEAIEPACRSSGILAGVGDRVSRRAGTPAGKPELRPVT